MTEISADPGRLSVDILIDQLAEALKDEDVGKYTQLAKNIFDYETEYPEKDDRVRDLLTRYGDEILKRSPHDFASVHPVQEILRSRNFQDLQIRDWLRKTMLDEAEYLLTQDSLSEKNLESGFEIFRNIINAEDKTSTQGTLLHRISKLVHSNIARFTTDREWSLLRYAIDQLTSLWFLEDELHHWLKTTSVILKDVEEFKIEYEKSQAKFAEFRKFAIGAGIILFLIIVVLLFIRF
jgi:hypothetical protein